MTPARPLRALALLGPCLLGLASCGAVAASHEATSSDVVSYDTAGRAELAPTTTTTVAPTTTTTAPPVTTTAPPPPPTAPPAPAPTSAPVVVAAAPAPSPTPSPNSEARMLQLINQARAAQGVPALRLRGGATTVARGWSQHMAGHGMSHNPDLSGDLARHGVTGWHAIGENVGYGSSVDQVFQAFMASSGHRANILKTAYSEVGIGVVDGGQYLWVTVDFVGY